MNSPPSLYLLVLNKIKSLEYPELIYLQTICGKKLCHEIVEYFKQSKYTMYKKYRYKRDSLREFIDPGIHHFNYLTLSYLKNNLLEKKVKIKSLKNLCFDVLYKENTKCFSVLKRYIPRLIFNDINNCLKHRNSIFNFEEEFNFITIQKFTDINNIKNQNVLYRDLLDISIPGNSQFDRLKINKPIILEIICNIIELKDNYIVIHAPKLYYLKCLETFIINNYLDKQKYNFKSCINQNNTSFIYSYKYLITDLPGFSIIGKKCLDKHIKYKIHVKIDLIKKSNQELSLKLYLHNIKELEYYL